MIQRFNQFALFQLNISDRKFAEKLPSLFYSKPPTKQSTREPAGLLNYHGASRNNPGRNGALDLDSFRADRPHKLRFAFSVYQNRFSLDASSDLALELNVNISGTDQTPPHGTLNFSRFADNPVTAQIAFVRDDHAATRPNRPAEIAYDPIILNIDIGATLRTDRGSRVLRYFAFPRAFKAVSNNGALNAEETLQLMKNRRLLLYSL
jgi:hypothetical protein